MNRPVLKGRLDHILYCKIYFRMGQCKMQSADWLQTIVFRVRKQWDYFCQVLICMVKTIVCSLHFTLTVTCLQLNLHVRQPSLVSKRPPPISTVRNTKNFPSQICIIRLASRKWSPLMTWWPQVRKCLGQKFSSRSGENQGISLWVRENWSLWKKSGKSEILRVQYCY